MCVCKYLKEGVSESKAKGKRRERRRELPATNTQQATFISTWKKGKRHGRKNEQNDDYSCRRPTKKLKKKAHIYKRNICDLLNK